ncbi:hypothetical protein EYF80_010984 [Liparis tanakae]|uniref:Uncharacterized protein n=1 Tax=Liparis tanakae TaxID=230148 RepID=A0A4Z2IMV5_9TELE|nr:hypothetical protein EYF80_010984 [Liparis tanakae]
MAEPHHPVTDNKHRASLNSAPSYSGNGRSSTAVTERGGDAGQEEEEGGGGGGGGAAAGLPGGLSQPAGSDRRGPGVLAAARCQAGGPVHRHA